MLIFKLTSLHNCRRSNSHYSKYTEMVSCIKFSNKIFTVAKTRIEWKHFLPNSFIRIVIVQRVQKCHQYWIISIFKFKFPNTLFWHLLLLQTTSFPILRAWFLPSRSHSENLQFLRKNQLQKYLLESLSYNFACATSPKFAFDFVIQSFIQEYFPVTTSTFVSAEVQSIASYK